MAGRLERENDGSDVEGCLNTLQEPKNPKKRRVFSDFDKINNRNGKTEWTFDEFLKTFFGEIYGVSCLRPLPLFIGEGKTVDLLKLRISVTKRGGYCSVSKKGLWSSIALDCGFDFRVSAPLKLVYVKHLDSLDRWLTNEQLKGDGGGGIEERYLGFRRVLMELESSKVEKDDDDQQMNDSKKRKRESCVGILNWIHKVAKDPVGPTVEPLPERQKWKSYGSDLQWKQILAFREAVLLKKNVDGGSQQWDWQKKQKMHPSMYDDDQSSSERLRFSHRLKDYSRKAQEWSGNDSSSSSSHSDEDNANKQSDYPTYLIKRKKKAIPISPHHQAELPDLQGVNYEGEHKWLGTKIWPLVQSEQNKKTLIERDLIGRGRQGSCGCQIIGSLECVKFHVGEKKMKIKLELGSAYYSWKLDKMGEDVAFSWLREDQNKFQHVVWSNRVSSQKYFLQELSKNFPKKGREALVSYYFNVFLLRRRGMQNRTSPSDIDSDDEESGSVPVGNRFGAGSILCSPKKGPSSER